MSLFKNLFGSKPPSKPGPPAPQLATAPTAKPTDPANDPNMIRVFDAYGREMYITKQQWHDSVLVGHLKKVWDDPEALYATIVQSLKDGFGSEMVQPAEHLASIDPNAERSVTVLAIVYREQKRLDDSEKVLRAHIGRHGESGVVLTNLAKVHSGRGQSELALKTLWHALELDPNQDNGLMWYQSTFREKDGEAGALAAFRRVADLPGSWRARLWLARDALANRRLEEALRLYDEALGLAPRPVPTDLLTQMSGDLGNQAHLPELLRLTTPHFDVAAHGILVGNNLIKANLDLGRLDEARALIDRLYAQKRPDWRQTLSFWDNEVAKARVDTSSADLNEKPRMTLFAIDGPIWLPEKSPAAELFPISAGEPVRVGFLGGTATMAAMPAQPTAQVSDAPGRLSRATSLFLAEQVRFSSGSTVRTLVPWLQSGPGAFILSGVPWKDADAAQQARATTPPCDYVVTTHLSAEAEPWRTELRLIRTIDGVCLGTANATFQAAQLQDGLPGLADRLLGLLAEHADVTPTARPDLYQIPTGVAFGDYLLRLEQLLAVTAAGMDGVPRGFLSGERDIVLGNLQLCLSQPNNVNVRILLLQTCAALKRVRPGVVAEFREKLELLQREHPLAGPAHGIAQRMLNEVIAA